MNHYADLIPHPPSRQLSPSQLAVVALDIEKIEAERAKERQGARTDIVARMPQSDAAEIRLRAERRLGELIRERKESGGLNTGTRGQLKGRDSSGGAIAEPPETPAPKLSDFGIDKKLSSRAQMLAAVPEKEFDSSLADWRGLID